MSAPKLRASESALLVIDMQNGFAHPDSAMGRSPAGTRRQRAIVPAVLELAALMRERGAPVVWTRQEHFPGDRARARRRFLPHSAKQGFLPCLRGTWETGFYGPVEEAVGPQDHVVEKHRASAFYDTNLGTKLRMLGTRFLFVAGCNTEFCVESTVRDAYARDLEVIVVSDCVAGIRPRSHAASLEVMGSYFAEVMPLKDVRRLL